MNKRETRMAWRSGKTKENPLSECNQWNSGLCAAMGMDELNNKVLQVHIKYPGVRM